MFELPHQGALHHRSPTSDRAMGARTRARGRAAASRQQPTSDAHASRDGRASLRHAQDADGRDALPDEDATARRYRDGAARPCLQSHPRHEHRWHPTAHGSNEGIARDIRASLSAETPLRPRSSHRLKGQSVSAPPRRFRTTKTRSGCRWSKFSALRVASYPAASAPKSKREGRPYATTAPPPSVPSVVPFTLLA